MEVLADGEHQSTRMQNSACSAHSYGRMAVACDGEHVMWNINMFSLVGRLLNRNMNIYNIFVTMGTQYQNSN